MSSGKRDIEKIEEKLFAAWKTAEALPGEGWHRKLMDDIRAGSETKYNQIGEVALERTAWRFAIAAGIAALLLFAHAFHSGIFMGMDLSTLFALDPGGFMISPPFGLV